MARHPVVLETQFGVPTVSAAASPAAMLPVVVILPVVSATAKAPPSAEMPPLAVNAPVTVAVPLTATVDCSAVAPPTASVPPMVVLPLVSRTVNPPSPLERSPENVTFPVSVEVPPTESVPPTTAFLLRKRSLGRALEVRPMSKVASGLNSSVPVKVLLPRLPPEVGNAPLKRAAKLAFTSAARMGWPATNVYGATPPLT